jgi:hypothetical protein
VPRSTSSAVSSDTGANRCHRHVHPNVDLAKFDFHFRCGGLDRRGIGHVGRDSEGAHAVCRPQLARHALQPVRVACQKRNIITLLCELLDCGPANPRARACDNSDLGHSQILRSELQINLPLEGIGYRADWSLAPMGSLKPSALH